MKNLAWTNSSSTSLYYDHSLLACSVCLQALTCRENFLSKWDNNGFICLTPLFSGLKLVLGLERLSSASLSASKICPCPRRRPQRFVFGLGLGLETLSSLNITGQSTLCSTFPEECLISLCSSQRTLSRWLTVERIFPETSFLVQLNRHFVYIFFSTPKAKIHHLKAQIMPKISEALHSYETLLFIYKLFTQSLPD